jgi:hypothetical protein
VAEDTNSGKPALLLQMVAGQRKPRSGVIQAAFFPYEYPYILRCETLLHRVITKHLRIAMLFST